MFDARPELSPELDDEQGDKAATFEAAATVDRSPTPAHEDPVYLAKYEAGIKRLGWTPPHFAADYPVLIRLTIDRIRSWED